MLKKLVFLYLSVFLIYVGFMPRTLSWAQDTKKIYGLAVLDLQAINISELEAKALSDMLRSSIARTITGEKGKTKDSYRLLERSQMDKIFEQFEVQNFGCTDISCAVEYGKMLNVERIVIGSVSLVGSTYLVIARIVDVESSTTLMSVDRKVQGAIDNVIDLMPVVSHELLTGERLAAPAPAIPSKTTPVTSTSVPATKPYAGGRIAFASDRYGNMEIYVMDADGSNQRRLTNSPHYDNSPSWSPDGTRIAFTSKRDGNYEIYVMDADGSNQRRLTNSTHYDNSPSWSPDGARIAFDSSHYDNYEIYVMDADGGNQLKLTNNPAVDWYPSWSPDGARIAFDSYRDGNYEIYVMDSDGSNQRNLTNNPAQESSPSWSPDGARIAFRSNRDGNNEIYVMDSDRSNERRLTNNSADDRSPSWSPF